MAHNPFGHGPRQNPPPLANARFLRGDEPPRPTAILYGTYHVVYSWPPPAQVLDAPPRMRLFEPCMLGSTLFGCICGPEISNRLQPVKVDYIERPTVHACELVSREADVIPGLNMTRCRCRFSPLGDKFVALPINKDVVLFFQRRPGTTYTKEVPFTCLLLFKFLPSEAEIKAAVQGFEIARQAGGLTFRPRSEE